MVRELTNGMKFIQALAVRGSEEDIAKNTSRLQ